MKKLSILIFVLSCNIFATESDNNQKRKPDSMKVEKYCFSNENSESFNESCYSSAILCEQRRIFWSEVQELKTKECKVIWN